MLNLNEITDFHEYIRALQEYKGRYLIIVAVKDALADSAENGPFYPHSESLFQEMTSIGFKSNLHGSFRKSFAAVIENGICVYEHLASDEYKSIEYVDGKVLVKSAGFLCGDFCSICIDDVEYATNDIGLNIVVYDYINKKLIDSVAVNMLKKEISMSRKRCTMPKNYRFRLENIHAAGYSLAMFVKEQNIRNIGIYVEKRKKDDFVFEILQSVLLDIAMVDYWVSDEEFSMHFGNYKTISFHKYDKVLVKKDTCLLIFGDMPMSAFISMGCKKKEMNEILPNIERYVFWERYLQEFQNQHPDVTLVTVEFPVFPRKNYSKNESRIIECQKNNCRMDAIYSNYEELGYDKEAVDEMFYRPRNQVTRNDSYYFEDFVSRHITIQNGHRFTPPGHSTGRKNIFFMGECFLFGYGADDSHTIEAYLQQSIDDNSLDIAVQNYGMFCWGIGDNSYKKIYDLPVKSGDIVITNIIGEPKFLESPNLNLTELFQRPHSYGDNLFIDTLLHYNENGNKIIADKIYQYLDSHNFFEGYSSMIKEVMKPPQFGIKCEKQSIVDDAKKKFRDKSIKMYPELESYGEKLSGLRPRIGSIVMNCNPFTLGHRYLIEIASKQCAYVFVFVVEEDKSEFRFNDRIELVRSGVKDLVNVKVIPSGKFVISSVTFEEYFGKAKLQDKKIDTAFDVKIFAEFIAPSLGITARFAGEEPLDKITAQYNETMKRIFPKYGIEFIEIPRCENEGDVISASRVRKLLREGEYEKISKLVPISTLEYLKEKF